MIKLDKSFVKNLPEDDAIARIISCVSDVLKVRVMAEGVETEEQRQWLLEHGIQCGQERRPGIRHAGCAEAFTQRADQADERTRLR